MKDNILDIGNIDQPVYRIWRLSRFDDVLANGRNTLVKPAMWDDPFENALMKCPVRIAGNEQVELESLRNKLYGQCWCLQSESDAMWRIYSTHNGAREDEGVLTKTTVRKLMEAFWHSTSGNPKSCCVIGRVEYLSQHNVELRLADPAAVSTWIVNPDPRAHAASLLFKRDAFEHEQEVRLIFDANNGYDTRSNIYQYPVDPNWLFDEIVLDPRLDPARRDLRIAELESQGYRGPIRQSQLYYFTPRLLIFDL